MTEKRYGGAFFFSGLYRTEMFKLKDWKSIPAGLRAQLAPVKTRQQWNLLRYAHEVEFGINTIGKEKTCRGKAVIFSRCVLGDYRENPQYWNEGVTVAVDRNTGKYKASFKTFAHVPPGSKFNVLVNGQRAGSFTVKSRGLWLQRGWRYVNPLLATVGAVIAGTIYTMVGASGGMLMAAFQIILIGTAGPLGINGPNVLKPSNLPLVFFAPLAGLYRYWFKEKRLALPVALFFGAGLFVGAFWIGPPLSAKYLNLTAYKPWLGLLVLVMAARTIYEITPRGMNRRKAVKEIADRFDEEVRNAKAEGRQVQMGKTKTKKLSFCNCCFEFWGQEFKINVALFFFIGILIGIVGAAFGIGGGFILVPVMTMLGGLPMYIAVPISLFASMFASVAGIAGYMAQGYFPDMLIVGIIIAGALIGGLLGSRFQRRFTERQLKVALAAILIFLIFRFLGLEVWI